MSLESPIQEMKRQVPAQKGEKKAEKSQAELRAVLKKKLLAAKPAIDNGMAEYEKALADGTFEDASGEVAGSGEKRKEALQKKLLGMVERVENMRAQLDSGETLHDTPEADPSAIGPFLKETFEKWYSSDTTFTQPDQKLSTVNPADLDLSSRKADIDPTKFGEYTLNPECIGIDFENAKITSLDITNDKGYKALPSKDLATVAEYIVTTYGKKYILPDLSFYQWAIENSAKAHTVLNDDSKYYFFPGSVLRDRDGGWDVPGVGWRGRRSVGARAGWRMSGAAAVVSCSSRSDL